MSHNSAFGVGDFSWLDTYVMPGRIIFYEFPVIMSFYKTNIVTFALVNQLLQTQIRGYSAYFFFGMLSQGKEGTSQIILRKTVQKI